MSSKKQKSIIDALPLSIEVNFVPLATKGETKIKFSDQNGAYSRPISSNQKLLYSSSYNDIKNHIQSILQDDYMPLARKDRKYKFIPVSLPVGTSIFGRVLVKHKKIPKNKPICGDDNWKQYLSEHAVLDNYADKRLTSGNQKSNIYFIQHYAKYNLQWLLNQLCVNGYHNYLWFHLVTMGFCRHNLGVHKNAHITVGIRTHAHFQARMILCAHSYTG